MLGIIKISTEFRRSIEQTYLIHGLLSTIHGFVDEFLMTGFDDYT